MVRPTLRALSVFLCCAIFQAAAQAAPNRYLLLLAGDPVAVRFPSRHAPGADAYRRQLEAAHASLRARLEARGFTVTGSAVSVLNAIFVLAPASRLAELRALPGVKAVLPEHWFHRDLNRATPLVNAPPVWTALGGIGNAGAGVKIAILDTGIDQTNPAFQSTLAVPSGFPICSGSDCQFTNNKVIVARSYVKMLSAGTNPANPAADSRPDDDSARDRDGHGTAVAACAAGNVASGTVTFNGMAPGAYLGSYKVYGSPGVNDNTADDVVIQALDDAVSDGMDVISFSSGTPAFFGALDTGSACAQPSGTPCDAVADAFENAVKSGVTIAAAAGNSGYSGYYYPAYNVINSPATAPDVLAAGATTNAHDFDETVSVPAGPSDLQNISGATGTANTFYPGAVTLPLADSGTVCAAPPANSVYGEIALLESGSCSYEAQVSSVQSAGAVGAVIYMQSAGAPLAPSDAQADANLIPFIVISNTDGTNLKSYIDANPASSVTIDSAGREVVDTPDQNQLAGFSSAGPSIATSLIKPDVSATGTNMYTAAESYDPLGEVYSSTGFAAGDGTSFSTPLVAGAAALVKQEHLSFTPLEIRSAIIGGAAQSISTDDASSGVPLPVDIESYGAGLLNTLASFNANVSITPASVSFGIVNTLPQSQSIEITNTGSSTVNLTISNLANPNQIGAATVSLSQGTASLAAGASAVITMTLTGILPLAGEYSSYIQISNGAQMLNVPYIYIVPDLVAGNLIELGNDFDGIISQQQAASNLAVKLIDDYGAPIAGATVTYTASGDAQISNATAVTDNYGIATSTPMLGSQPGNYTFTASAAGMKLTFNAYARPQPVISSVENAANSGAAAVAPGSYASLIGTALSDLTNHSTTARLPLSIDQAIVSFDVPSAGISVPGHLTFVSPTQVNVQIPWELEGQTSAEVKVTINYSYGQVFVMPIAPYSPALFELSPGVVAAEDAGFNTISASNPAIPGQMISIFANGLGPVTNTPASGDPTSSSSVSMTTTIPVVAIGGEPAPVSFSGLTPGVASLYQVNVIVPTGIASGPAPISISIGGQNSPASSINVQ